MKEVVVFIASQHTASPRLRALWKVSEEDAKKICSDRRIAGRSWMLCWTAAGVDNPNVREYVPDDGRHADVLAEHGVTVLDSFVMQQNSAAQSI
ncbi:hypothetical protein [Streptomyces cacaoi]|nr:hypothetical protein [Streptomyces cacaoi]